MANSRVGARTSKVTRDFDFDFDFFGFDVCSESSSFELRADTSRVMPGTPNANVLPLSRVHQ
jgi:hypothetical protein